MPHEFLNGLRTGPPHGEVRTEGVPHAVNAAVGESGQILCTLHQHPHTFLRERFSAFAAQHPVVSEHSTELRRSNLRDA